MTPAIIRYTDALMQFTVFAVVFLELRLVFAGGGWSGTVVVQPINTQASIAA